MLRDSLKPNVTVQQPMAFERVVDLLAGGLGPGIRRDMAKTLTHSMNTLPILPPQYEQALLRGEGLALPGGDVKEVFNCPHEMYWGHQLPDLEFFIQPGMGIGVRALRDILAFELANNSQFRCGASTAMRHLSIWKPASQPFC